MSKLDDPQFLHERARIAAKARYNPEYRQQRNVAAAEDYIRRLVKTFPALTDDERMRLVRLLMDDDGTERLIRGMLGGGVE